MNEWMTIETVPKDGTLILVYFPQKGVRAVFWDSPYEINVTDKNGLWCVSDDRNDPYALRGYGYSEETQPTHWMNMPSKPKI